jgi:hypothetical protein
MYGYWILWELQLHWMERTPDVERYETGRQQVRRLCVSDVLGSRSLNEGSRRVCGVWCRVGVISHAFV